jgi:hypothetical protein
MALADRMRSFHDSCDALFAARLGAAGLAAVGSSDDEWRRDYVGTTSEHGRIYVRLSASMDPRDKPWNVEARITGRLRVTPEPESLKLKERFSRE